MKNQKVNINKRLERLSTFVDEEKNIIDVGCDHALLDIYLFQNRKKINIIASDIKEGPLKGAKENLKKYNLEDKIKLKLGPGIEPMEKETDTVIISGMGGLNMIGILKYKEEERKQIKTIILSPNNDVEKVRKEITKLGYYIDKEELVQDKDFIYPIIRFQKGKKKYKQEEYLFGPIILKERTELFKTYLEKKKQTVEHLLQVLPKKYIKRRFELKKELKCLERIL
ncbi:MAG: SAM-dependent methyltransferase [Firmicutes bacterium]|nr:SAM-dependent methyltransferase [Bacillota bacterium]